MVLEKVKAILAEQFDVEEDKITADTDLQEDLGADSLDVVDLLTQKLKQLYFQIVFVIKT